MGIESYAVGAGVEYANDVSIGGAITATPDGGVDGFNVKLKIGDTSKPKGVESVVTQSWRMLDGSMREVDLPRISAKPKDGDTRASIGATALFEPVGEKTGLTAQPHVSLSAGTNERGDEAFAVRAGVTLPDQKAQFTGSVSSRNGEVSAGLSDYAISSPNPNQAFGPGNTQVSSGSPKNLTGLNEDARKENLGLLKLRP